MAHFYFSEVPTTLWKLWWSRTYLIFENNSIVLADSSYYHICLFSKDEAPPWNHANLEVLVTLLTYLPHKIIVGGKTERKIAPYLHRLHIKIVQWNRWMGNWVLWIDLQVFLFLFDVDENILYASSLVEVSSQFYHWIWSNVS